MAHNVSGPTLLLAEIGTNNVRGTTRSVVAFKVTIHRIPWIFHVISCLLWFTETVMIAPTFKARSTSPGIDVCPIVYCVMPARQVRQGNESQSKKVLSIFFGKLCHRQRRSLFPWQLFSSTMYIFQAIRYIGGFSRTILIEFCVQNFEHACSVTENWWRETFNLHTNTWFREFSVRQIRKYQFIVSCLCRYLSIGILLLESNQCAT